MKITQQMVAEAAGVSVATVSRALAGRENIPEETRRRIARIARRLGYLPGSTSKRARRVMTIGTLIQNEFGPPAHSILGGITSAASHAGIGVAVQIVHAADRGALLAQIGDWPALVGGGLAGVVAIGNWPDGLLAEALGTIPTVSVIGGDAVEIIQLNGATAATDAIIWLRQQGHRRIGFLTSPGVSTADSTVEAAIRHQAAIVGDESPQILASNDHNAIRRQTMAGVTAWLCGERTVGRQTMEILGESKLRVPGDVSVVPLEPADESPDAFWAGTTYPWRQIGALAYARLQGRISAAEPLPTTVSLVGGVFRSALSAAAVPGRRPKNSRTVRKVRP